MSRSPLARLTHKLLLYWDVFDPSPLGRYRRLSRPIDGWLTRDEEATLFGLAAAVPRDRCIVELGSWFGRSAILLGGGARRGHGAPVYSVDLFRASGCAKELLEDRVGAAAQDYWDRFQQHMRGAGLAELVSAVRGDTAQTGSDWSGPPVGLVFIDADHTYDGVKRDWTHWLARLAPHAIVAFHDYKNPAYEGVTRLVDELCAGGRLRQGRRRDSIYYGEVVQDAAAR